jgi:glycosyltransferase involved in cell wall biosynthesis
MKTLLVDLTSLDTPSRRRGFGRYVRDLAVGLSRLPPGELGQLRLLGLTHLGLGGEYRVTEQLDSFNGSPEIPVPTARDHYHWAYRRRLGLFRAVKNIGADAVHLGDAHATPLLMGLSHCRRIVTCHDAIPMHFPQRYMGWRDGGPLLGAAIERRRYRSADLVVAISDATLNDVLAIHRVPPERVVRVYNGVDVERWSRVPELDVDQTLREFGLQKQPFVLFVGGYHWHKNVEGMMAGIALARQRGADLTLVWAGALSDSQTQHIKAVAEQAGASDALRLIGYVSDEQVAILYRSAVAHVLLSRFEGFGLTIIEAMASGCPVMTTRAGSLGEIAGDAALTVDPEDHVAVGAGLVRLATDSGYRANLSQRGRERAPRFSLQVQAREMARVFRDFLQV